MLFGNNHDATIEPYTEILHWGLRKHDPEILASQLSNSELYTAIYFTHFIMVYSFFIIWVNRN